MWKTLAGWMQAAGLGEVPRTLLYELARIKSGDVVLPESPSLRVGQTDPRPVPLPLFTPQLRFGFAVISRSPRSRPLDPLA